MYFIRVKGMELARLGVGFDDGTEYVILDTEDCVVETYTGKQLKQFSGIKYENIRAADRYRSEATIQGVGSYKIESLLGGEVTCSIHEDFSISSKSGACLRLIEGYGKEIRVHDGRGRPQAILKFERSNKLVDSYIVWAERISVGIRIVFYIVTNVSYETTVGTSVQNSTAFIHLLYKDGKFYFEKVVAFDSNRCQLVTDLMPDKLVLTKLSLLPQYGIR